MPKVNKKYESLFMYLVRQEFPLMSRVYGILYPVGNDENAINLMSGAVYDAYGFSSVHAQLIGGLQPFEDMRKDFVNTFNSYKSFRNAITDFCQPFYGLGNIVFAIVSISVTPIVFLVNTLRYAAISGGSIKNFLGNMTLNVLKSASWLIDGAASLVRGVTQIIATPLTLFIKMPLRGLLTAVFGFQKISENTGIERLVKEGCEAINSNDGYSMECIQHELHRKYCKSIKQGQSTNIDKTEEAKLYDYDRGKYGSSWVSPIPERTKSGAMNYLGLFSNNIQADSSSSEANQSTNPETTATP